MIYPKLTVDLTKIGENSSTVCSMCRSYGINIAAVTKGVCTNSRIARAMTHGGATVLADSRLKNIIHLRKTGFTEPTMLLRIPMMSELEDLLEWSDYSLISSEETLTELNEICKRKKTGYGVILMIDLGDLREGILPSEADHFSHIIKKCPYIRCMGVGVNFGCYGGTVPTPPKLSQLADIAKEMENYLGYPMEFVSGGGTSSLRLIRDNTMPRGINQLRIGEAILMGSDIGSNKKLSYLNSDTMRLEVELIEVRTKPSVPNGEIGLNAFGQKPIFIDRGSRLRAIAAIGKQDLRIDGITPVDDRIDILGASSDHLLLDVEDVKPRPKVGDIVQFSLNYAGTLSACTSPYVNIDFK